MIPHALLLEDDAPSLDALDHIVRSKGFDTVAVRTLAEARNALSERIPDIAVLDLELPDGNGTDLVGDLRGEARADILILTGHGSIDSAVRAMHAGVADYLTKPLDVERFDLFLERTKRRVDGRLRVGHPRPAAFSHMVGSSPAIQHVYEQIELVAPTNATVLLAGETGCGKDVIAHAIHRASPRADQPFVAVNCGAIQPTLIESELFGHETGSFTGADRLRRGVFEQATGGTLFLDEITEMPADMQVRLLRVLESRTVTRVGGEKPIDVDVRLLAATNRSPEDAVAAGRLREDLFYRLKVFPIRVPPLREREGDVALLAESFLAALNEKGEQAKALDASAAEKLAGHAWPGNVRELRNVIERAFIMSRDCIQAEHVDFGPTTARPADSRAGDVALDVGTSIAEAEKELILATLEQLGGNKKQAASVLGISLKTLYNRLNSYGLGRGQS